MKQLCHPRIVSLIEEQDSPEWLFLVMELISGETIQFHTKYTLIHRQYGITGLSFYCVG